MNTLVYNKTNNKKETIKWKVLSIDGGKNFLEIIFNANNIFKRKKVTVHSGEDLTMYLPDDNLVMSYKVRDEDEILKMIEESTEEI